MLKSYLITFFISMVPVIELRGGLPYGITLGLDYPLALTAAVLGSALASSGLWALVGRRADKDDAERKMLVGLAHDRIVHLGMAYVERGYITQDEYENLRVYLYEPYEKMGGNGSARRVMLEVDKLPVHKM